VYSFCFIESWSGHNQFKGAFAIAKPKLEPMFVRYLIIVQLPALACATFKQLIEQEISDLV